jgi:hypothetical protein
MLIVQDILVAVMIRANVELFGRVGCHYQANSYGNCTQAGTVPIWDVFDQESTLRRLHEFGICVVESKNDRNKMFCSKFRLCGPCPRRN